MTVTIACFTGHIPAVVLAETEFLFIHRDASCCPGEDFRATDFAHKHVKLYYAVSHKRTGLGIQRRIYPYDEAVSLMNRVSMFDWDWDSPLECPSSTKFAIQQLIGKSFMSKASIDAYNLICRF